MNNAWRLDSGALQRGAEHLKHCSNRKSPLCVGADGGSGGDEGGI